MRFGTTLAFAVALGAAALAPRAARACGSGGGSYSGVLVVAGAIALGLGIADVGFTVHDLATLASGKHPSRGSGIGEIVVAGPQLLLGTVATLNDPRPSPWLLAYTGWMAFLTAHGIWTVATASDGTPFPPMEEPPAPLEEAAIRARAPGLSLSLGPTFVDVGPLSRPGLGVVGRF